MWYRVPVVELLIGLALIVVQALAGYMGFHVSISPFDSSDQSYAERVKKWRRAFVGLTCISIVLTTVLSIRSAQSANEVLNLIKTLAAQGKALSNNQTRLLALQIKLDEKERAVAADQRTLVAQSKTIALLADKAIGTTTGGKSFCYMRFLGSDPRLTLTSARPFFVARGAFPIYDVRARIVNQRLFDKLPPKQQATWSSPAEMSIDVGELAPNVVSVQTSFTLSFTDPPAMQRFLVQFSARNGTWTEYLRLARVKEVWIEAVKVTKDNAASTLIYECIPKEFPLSQLDWKPSRNSCAG
jgi:hypothetical protein